jgi:hypothetical protein
MNEEVVQLDLDMGDLGADESDASEPVPRIVLSKPFEFSDSETGEEDDLPHGPTPRQRAQAASLGNVDIPKAQGASLYATFTATYSVFIRR